MRMLATFHASEQAHSFSAFLQKKGVAHTCEEVKEKEPLYHIWIVDEDDMRKATALLNEWRSHPQEVDAEPFEEEEPSVATGKPRSSLSPSPYGVISKGVIVIAILLFFWNLFHQGITVPPPLPGIVQAPVLKSAAKALIFDYPAYFEKRDALLKLYPPEAIQKEEPPSAEAKQLMQTIRETPFWNGIYDRFVAHFKNRSLPLKYTGPLCEKISQGEYWRLFTPCLLHYDLLHILFNLLWFILLGNQIEYRIGKLRYLIVIVTSAIASNVAQYFMSGPFFMGLSGVVVALAAFIWARQQKAPWEGYLLQRATLLFLGIFIIGIFGLQMVFFFLQLFSNTNVTIQIANTAHLVGGGVGYICGKMKFFALQKREK